MNKYQATLFSNESDIYTALHSNNARITDVTLRKVAFQRGIIFPEKLTKEDLIEKISDLPFSYSHIREIQDKLATKSSQDVFSVKRIYDDFDIEKLYDVVNRVINNRPKLLGHEKIEHYSGFQTYHISIDYTEFDFRRGKFQQKKLYSGNIIFIIRNGYVSVRYNYTPRISEILNQIIETYSLTVTNNININEIDLSAIVDTDLRNNFAVHLYDFDGNYRNTGFEYAGLEKVRVSRIKTILNITESDTAENNSEEKKDDLSDSLGSAEVNDTPDGYDEDIATDDDENLTFNINNAAYDGLSLVNAPQIKDLCSDGFYRSLIRWKSLSSSIKNHTITFELSFDDKYYGRNIKFRALHKENNSSSGVREKLSDSDFDQVMKQLEEKIFLINDFIIEEHAKRYPAVNTMLCATLNQEAG
ncbi:TPA: hypothetical protein PXJ37_002472 [Yersinia enterocolitica]|nr:hypothetical protein [Yersinia enterocolitica]HEF7274262.1 hypothetical protein [Yersinia enterocolitica]HEK6331048.1 hypothetical protein [Yersinia enterocolitica]